MPIIPSSMLEAFGLKSNVKIDFKLPVIDSTAFKNNIEDAKNLKSPDFLPRSSSLKELSDKLERLNKQRAKIAGDIAAIRAELKNNFTLDEDLVPVPNPEALEKIEQLTRRLGKYERSFATVHQELPKQLAVDELVNFKRLLETMPDGLKLIFMQLYEVGTKTALIALLNDYESFCKNDSYNIEKYMEFLEQASTKVDRIVLGAAKRALQSGEAGATKVSYSSAKTLRDNPASAFKRNLGVEDDIPGIVDLSDIGQVDDMILARNKQAEAARELADQTSYNDLSDLVKEQLVAQRAYLIRLHAIISLGNIPLDSPLHAELTSYYDTLQRNITNSLQNEREAIRGQQDFEKIKQEIESKRNAIIGACFNKNFYTLTNAKTGAIITGTLFTAMFNGFLGKEIAKGLAFISVVALYKDAEDKAEQMVDELLQPMQKLMAAGLSSQEAKKILDMDKLFAYGLNNKIPEPKQTVFGQMKVIALPLLYITASVLGAVVFAYILPLVLPAVGAAIVIGAVVGACFGLGVVAIAHNVFARVFKGGSGIDNSGAIESKIDLDNLQAEPRNMHENQIAILNKLHTGFSDMLLKHFKEGFADIDSRIKAAQLDDKPDKLVIKKISDDLGVLEKDWSEMLNAINKIGEETSPEAKNIAADEACKLLFGHLRRGYIIKRDLYLQKEMASNLGNAPTPEASITNEEKNKLPGAAIFNMNFKVDFVAKNKKLEEHFADLTELVDIVRTIENKPSF